MSKRVHNFIWGFLYTYPLIFVLIILISTFKQDFGVVDFDSFSYTISNFFNRIIDCSNVYMISDGTFGLSITLTFYDFFFQDVQVYSFLQSYIAHIINITLFHIAFDFMTFLPNFIYYKLFKKLGGGYYD